jgi:pimeloyl-ACP methyl ester carboxylesterase
MPVSYSRPFNQSTRSMTHTYATAATKQPTLIVNGANDIMVPTINSWIMSQQIPTAQLIVYPDAGHAAHYQYPELFLKHSKLLPDL